ncbi:hypothetical protein BV20DRAFT_974845 [Pilatotrama ljubarskyi]|nr:hypothetical protein BV20DRAFT_974845 [Pilatotrama ljubarskyi]
MVPGYNKITRKKSEMDVDPSSSQEARITAADFSFGLLEAKQEGHVFVQEDTVFTPPYSDGSDYASPEHLPDVDQLTDMAVSQAPQPTQQSDMSIEELDSETDTVCMPGTREPTPMPGVPQVSTQYLSRMESIHQLGPAVSAGECILLYLCLYRSSSVRASARGWSLGKTLGTVQSYRICSFCSPATDYQVTQSPRRLPLRFR